MKTSLLFKSAALCLSLSVGFYLFPQEQHLSTASCSNTLSVSQNGVETFTVQCAITPQTSWMSWFSGQSSSAQFHFIDLLELLSRFQAKPAA